MITTLPIGTSQWHNHALSLPLVMLLILLEANQDLRSVELAGDHHGQAEKRTETREGKR